jgi:RHS repeat-associated protein
LTGIGQQNSNGWQYFNTDGLGSVRQMTDAAGTVTYRASYEPYGTPFDQWPNPQTAATFGYTGESTDANSLVYLRARYYDPRLGVFLSRDPFEGVMTRSGSMNGYNYVEGNPANYTDPSGNCIFGIDTAICVGVLVGAIVGGTIAFGTDVAIQHYWEGQSWDELNWRRAFIAGGIGAITGGITGGFGAWTVGAVAARTLTVTQAAVSSFALDVGLGVIADTMVYGDDVGSALVSNIAGNIAGDIAGRAVGRAFRSVRGILRELDSLSFAGREAWPEFTPAFRVSAGGEDASIRPAPPSSGLTDDLVGALARFVGPNDAIIVTGMTPDTDFELARRTFTYEELLQRHPEIEPQYLQEIADQMEKRGALKFAGSLEFKPEAAVKLDPPGKLPGGLRKVQIDETGDIRWVLNDLDVAGYIRNGELLTNEQFRREILPDLNLIIRNALRFKQDLIRHGPKGNGLLISANRLAQGLEPLKGVSMVEIPYETTYIIQRSGFIDSGFLADTLTRYDPRWYLRETATDVSR